MMFLSHGHMAFCFRNCDVVAIGSLEDLNKDFVCFFPFDHPNFQFVVNCYFNANVSNQHNSHKQPPRSDATCWEQLCSQRKLAVFVQLEPIESEENRKC